MSRDAGWNQAGIAHTLLLSRCVPHRFFAENKHLAQGHREALYIPQFLSTTQVSQTVHAGLSVSTGAWC
jgi:hypothetical protein